MGFALFRDVHPAETLQAADDGHGHLGRELVNGVQHPVDAKTHAALLAAWFDMNVTGALGKGVLEQPVDDIDDMRIVGVRFLILGAEVKQLFEVTGTADFHVASRGTANRLR